MRPTPARPGQLLGARWFNEIIQALRKAKIIPGQGIAVRDTPGGQVISLKMPQEVDFRVTSGTNPYGGVEQSPIAGGLWADLTGGRTVTTSVDPLYERNKNASVPAGTIVRARRDPGSGAWIFDRSACTATAVPKVKPAPAPSPGLISMGSDPSAFTRLKPRIRSQGLNSPPWSGLKQIPPLSDAPLGDTGTGISNPVPPPP